ncbi:MAG: tetratricopeptide repeat protein [Acidobacteriaceae bacterium]
MHLSFPFPVTIRPLFALCVYGAICSAILPPRLLASPAPSSPAAYLAIHRDLTDGHADEAISLLATQLSLNASDANAHQLLCRVYIQEERWHDAEGECEQAVRLDPNNSSDHLWLGRAYGVEAAHASLGRAYSLARKIRVQFETAVQLDSRNISALSDLGEYDVDVPRLIGGGVGRAEKIATQLAPLDPTRFHALQAKIDEKKSDLTGAENEWKQAIQSSAHPAKQWMELAEFYARQKNFPAMRQAIANGVAADHGNGRALVAGASLLMQHHQNLPQATRMLRQYLASPNQSEEAPAFQVRAQLGSLLASQGKQADAQTQYAEAHALAGNFVPTQPGHRE